VSGSRPYDLRHSFASLLIAEGRSVVDVAAQLGHSPNMMLSTHAHLVEELDGRQRRPASGVIRAARRAAR
jgi:integrase